MQRWSKGMSGNDEQEEKKAREERESVLERKERLRDCKTLIIFRPLSPPSSTSGARSLRPLLLLRQT